MFKGKLLRLAGTALSSASTRVQPLAATADWVRATNQKINQVGSESVWQDQTQLGRWTESFTVAEDRPVPEDPAYCYQCKDSFSVISSFLTIRRGYDMVILTQWGLLLICFVSLQLSQTDLG